MSSYGEHGITFLATCALHQQWGLVPPNEIQHSGLPIHALQPLQLDIKVRPKTRRPALLVHGHHFCWWCHPLSANIEMLAACRDYFPNDQTGSRVWTSIPRSPGGCLLQSFAGLLPLHICVSSLAASWTLECCTSCTCRLLTNLYNGHIYLWNINDQVSSWAWAELPAVTNAL